MVISVSFFYECSLHQQTTSKNVFDTPNQKPNLNIENGEGDEKKMRDKTKNIISYLIGLFHRATTLFGFTCLARHQNHSLELLSNWVKQLYHILKSSVFESNPKLYLVYCSFVFSSVCFFFGPCAPHQSDRRCLSLHFYARISKNFEIDRIENNISSDFGI